MATARRKAGPGKRPDSPTTRRTHRRLVDAARAELARKGGFTAERVAARAGTSTATFYQYFPAKRDALAAAFGDLMRDLDAFVEAHASLEALVDQGLPAWCRTFVGASARFFGENALVFRAALAALPGDRELRQIYRQEERASLDTLRRFFERGQRAGQIRAGDADVLARSFLVLAQGLNNPLVLQRRGDDPVLEVLADTLERLLAPDAP